MGEYHPLKSVGLASMAADEFYARTWEKYKAGKPCVWVLGASFVGPILEAMDLPWVFGDAVAAHISARHKEGHLLQLAEERGYFPDTCTYTRIHMATVLLSEEEKANGPPEWRVPPPTCVIIADGSCSEWNGWGDDVKKRLKVPLFTCHVPTVWKGDGRDEGEYLNGKLKEMITFLEDTTHAKFSMDKLREVVSVVARARAEAEQALEFSKSIPSPATAFDWTAALAGIINAFGQESSVQAFAAMRKEAGERVARKEGAVVGEKYRLMWDGLMCYPKMGHLARKFAHYDASLVVGTINPCAFFSNMPTDIRDPLRNMAMNVVGAYCNLPLDGIIDTALKIAQDFSIDGLVAHAHYTCRPLCAWQPALMDALSRKAAIPSIFIEADMADPSFYNDAQVDTRLQTLLEMIEAKKKRRAR